MARKRTFEVGSVKQCALCLCFVLFRFAAPLLAAKRGALIYKRPVIAIIALAMALIAQGAFTVKFGSEMDVEIDGQVQTFAMDSREISTLLAD